MNMLENAKIIQNDGMLDVEAVERYIVEALGGTIGEEYSQMKENITFTEGEIIDTPENGKDNDEQDNQSTENKYYSLIEFLINVISAILAWLF